MACQWCDTLSLLRHARPQDRLGVALDTQSVCQFMLNHALFIVAAEHIQNYNDGPMKPSCRYIIYVKCLGYRQATQIPKVNRCSIGSAAPADIHLFLQDLPETCIRAKIQMNPVFGWPKPGWSVLVIFQGLRQEPNVGRILKNIVYSYDCSFGVFNIIEFFRIDVHKNSLLEQFCNDSIIGRAQFSESAAGTGLYLTRFLMNYMRRLRIIVILKPKVQPLFGHP